MFIKYISSEIFRRSHTKVFWCNQFKFCNFCTMSDQEFSSNMGNWRHGKFSGRIHHLWGKERSSSQVKSSVKKFYKGNSRYGQKFGGRPRHLRGKEIGLYYARLSRKKKGPKDYYQQHSSVQMDGHTEQHITGLLQKMKNITPQLDDSFGDACSASTSHNFCINYHTSREYEDNIDSYDHGLIQTPLLDKHFMEEMKQKYNNPDYKNMLEFRKRLPAFKMRHEIIETIESNQVVVISGETGCGKTTQVTQFILDHYIELGKGSLCKIVCTQPRRISAISVAERVAQERTENCGNGSVGYQIRLESKLPREQGSILYCTTGIVLQRLQGDPSLDRTSHIIIDEIHERDLQSDFLLIILKELCIQRPNLKVILMSATLNAELFSKYFGNCPMLMIPGFTFPVTEYLLEDVLEMTGYSPDNQYNQNSSSNRRKGMKKFMRQREEYLFHMEPFFHSLEEKYSRKTIETLRNWNEEEIDLDLIVALLKHIIRFEKDGAVLIFLPGWELISNLHKLLSGDFMFNSSRCILIPLHSLMPTVNQKEVFNRPPSGMRKIIIATNIAETSITIDDVVFVIDCGKIKISSYDKDADLDTLQPEWIALANARQRRGRAGRVQPGICYHLYTKARENLFDDYQLPEMLRTRLETMFLKIKLLNFGMIEPFISKAMEPPSPVTVRRSIDMLIKLNAFDDNENLTPLGYQLANLPLDPHTGKMILFGAMFSCLDPICTVAASLSFKDAFIVPLGKEQIADHKRKQLAGSTQSDHLMLVRAFKGWEQAKQHGCERQYCWNNFLSPNTLKMLSSLKNQFAQYLKQLHFLHCDNPKHNDFNLNSDNENLVKAIICAGLYPKVAKLRKTQTKRRPPLASTLEDRRVQFHPKSVNSSETNFKTQWLIYHQKVKSTQIFLHDTTVVKPYPLLFFGGKISTSTTEFGLELVSVDDWITFKCSAKTAQVVEELRHELDNLLKYKIRNPGVTCWDTSKREGAVLNAVIELITSEENLDCLETDNFSFVGEDEDY